MQLETPWPKPKQSAEDSRSTAMEYYDKLRYKHAIKNKVYLETIKYQKEELSLV